MSNLIEGVCENRLQDNFSDLSLGHPVAAPKMLYPPFVHLALLFGLLVHAQSSPQLGFTPLAVKTPYLQGWIGNNLRISSELSREQNPANIWPSFVSADRTLGWTGMIRVDNKGHQWMGGNGEFDFTRTVASEITPTKSIFTIEAGPIQFNVTFFSPIEPGDYIKQSIPFSYLYIDGIVANDSIPHTVQVYSDITAEWVTRNDTTPVVWNTTDQSDLITYHRVERQNPLPMVEDGGISEDATAYYATTKRPGLTWQTGASSICRGNFMANGTLPSSIDTKFRNVSDAWPVFSFSVDLGTVSPGNQPDPVVWALGLVRDPLVTYTINGSTQNRSAYYWSNYTSIDEVMTTFLKDFPAALSQSVGLDNNLLFATSAASLEYAGILSLVTRQIFASMDITIPSAQPGKFNTSDVKIFMKDIGQSQRTNAVEVIYGALPALLYFNAALGRDLLQPLLEFQSLPQYPNIYAAPDLGISYPHVHDNSTDTYPLAVENCGNMLIMAYAQANKLGDSAFLARYLSVLQRWADFLIQNSLHPSGFSTADGLHNPDMSNLALKGILGIYSMAKINEILGVPNNTYMDQAMRLKNEWKQSAIAADGHIEAIYGHADSWGLMYNLFPAVWLNTDLIEDSVLASQAQFYAKQSSPKFGLDLDNSQSDKAYPHWTLMTAATIPDSLNPVRDQLINSVYQRAYMPNTTSPLPVTYNSSNGDILSGNGSPILGAAFAVLSMQHQSTPPSHRKSSIGAIVGGVLGGLAFLLVITAVIFIFWRKRKQPQGKQRQHGVDPFNVANHNNTNSTMAQAPHQAVVRDQRTSDGPGFSRPLSPQGVSEPLAMSRKQREALGLSRRHISTQSEVPLLASSGSDTPSASGTEDLRVEVERLRREVESYRYTTDAPPEYT